MKYVIIWPLGLRTEREAPDAKSLEDCERHAFGDAHQIAREYGARVELLQPAATS